MASAVLIGGIAVARGSLSLGALVAFTTLLVLLQFPIIDLGWILSMAQEAATAADRVCEVFDAAMVVRRPARMPSALAVSKGRLAFEHVSFSYPGAATPVLRDVNLTIEPGRDGGDRRPDGIGQEHAGLPSRRGSTTSPPGGSPSTGIDVRDITIESLRRHVAVVFEDPVLFSMSVRENLVLGRPDASDDEIADALELAQARLRPRPSLGARHSHRRAGHVAVRGTAPAAGPGPGRPRPPFGARARRPACRRSTSTPRRSSSRAWRECLRDMTGLLVVHRPSTVALANRVALLRDGCLVAVGTHHELMERPDYASVLSVGLRRVAGGVMSALEAWRGIAAEEVDEVPPAWTGLLRRRTRHLLRSLAAPHRRAIVLARRRHPRRQPRRHGGAVPRRARHRPRRRRPCATTTTCRSVVITGAHPRLRDRCRRSCTGCSSPARDGSARRYCSS